MIYLTEQKNDAEAVKWFRKAADQDVVADTMTEFLRIGVRLTELIAWVIRL
jgi:TPR repeat protein